MTYFRQYDTKFQAFDPIELAGAVAWKRTA